MAASVYLLADTGDRKTTLFIVKADTPGITLSPLKTIADEAAKPRSVLIRWRFPPKNVLGETNRGWAYLENITSKAALLKSTEMLGGSRKNPGDVCGVPDKSGGNSLGRPWGVSRRFSIKCAEMLTYVDLSRDMVYKPAWMIDQGMACDLDIAMAKAWTSDAYRRVVQTSFRCSGLSPIAKNMICTCTYATPKQAK